MLALLGCAGCEQKPEILSGPPADLTTVDTTGWPRARFSIARATLRVPPTWPRCGDDCWGTRGAGVTAFIVSAGDRTTVIDPVWPGSRWADYVRWTGIIDGREATLERLVERAIDPHICFATALLPLSDTKRPWLHLDGEGRGSQDTLVAIARTVRFDR